VNVYKGNNVLMAASSRNTNTLSRGITSQNWATVLKLLALVRRRAD
jgi:hypothetical protein